MRSDLVAPVLVAALALASSSCKKGGGAASPPRVDPGEAWCAEHRVPESACTLCRPALAAEFRAKGDWCDEHSLPESVCPICHPERAAGRPSRSTQSEPDDGAPADRAAVQLRSKDAARLAGIEC